jgi:hypothetical protein
MESDMTKTAAAPAPAPRPRRTPKPKPPPEPRADLLRRLLADIEEHDHHAHRPALFDRLIAEEGMGITTAGDPELTTVVMAGLSGTSASGRSAALQVWARYARRELLALDAEAAPLGAA